MGKDAPQLKRLSIEAFQDYPLLDSRKCLFLTATGPRVSVAALFITLSVEERRQWFAEGGSWPHYDNLGIEPEPMEAWLSQFGPPREKYDPERELGDVFGEAI